MGKIHKSKHKLRGGDGKNDSSKSKAQKEFLKREYTALYAKPYLSLRSLRKNSSSTAEAEN
jgi:hypothetical protein